MLDMSKLHRERHTNFIATPQRLAPLRRLGRTAPIAKRSTTLMSIIHLAVVGDEEPTPADLNAIEREWPLIEAELELLDAQIASINAGPHTSVLETRRVRRAERRVLEVGRELADRGPETEVVA